MERSIEFKEIEHDVKELEDYLNQRLYSPFLPKKDFVEDWNIFGLIVTKAYGPNSIFPKEYADNEVRIWLEHRFKVKALLKYCQWKLFNNKSMLQNNRKTDGVLMRIVIAKLNNLGLPRIYADEIFDNIHLQYAIRKPIFEDYFVIKILGLPF